MEANIGIFVPYQQILEYFTYVAPYWHIWPVSARPYWHIGLWTRLPCCILRFHPRSYNWLPFVQIATNIIVTVITTIIIIIITSRRNFWEPRLFRGSSLQHHKPSPCCHCYVVQVMMTMKIRKIKKTIMTTTTTTMIICRGTSSDPFYSLDRRDGDSKHWTSDPWKGRATFRFIVIFLMIYFILKILHMKYVNRC